MPFREHRGGGKLQRDRSNMPTIWDDEWVDVAPSTARCEPNLSWKLIKARIPPPARVLEAGCGPARWVKFFQEQGYDAYGIDFSPLAIQKSLETWPELAGKLCQGDLRSMPYENGFFDAIISFGAIEHDVNGPQAALADMLRVLKPGGTLYCTVPCMNRVRRTGYLALRDWMVRNPTIRRWTGRSPEAPFFEYVFYRDEYKRVLEAADFEVVELLPLEPMVEGCGGVHTLRFKLVQRLHARMPWTFTHMMAGFCRKPLGPTTRSS